MAASTVGMCENLRPWFASGLLFLFADDFLPQDTVANHSESHELLPQRHERNKVAQVERHAAAQTSAPVSPPTPPSALFPGADSLPAPWDAYWTKAGSDATRAYCITYMELGKNLGGHPNPGRSLLFKQLISRLPQLHGQTAFWPVSAFRVGALYPDAGQFLAGLQRFHSQTVLCFGLDAFRVLAPNAPVPRQSVTFSTVHGLTVYLLPQVDAIVQKGSEGLDIIVHDLAQMLSAHP